MIGPLIEPHALAALLAKPDPPSLLDVRWALPAGPDHDAYLAGHLPGAVFVDLDRDLADPPSERGRHPLPDPERFAAAMRAAGVGAQRPVVAYDAGSAMAAARAWWLLRYFGHPRVAVLDGGLRAWMAAGQPTTADVRPHDPGDFVARAGGMAVIGADEAAAIAREGSGRAGILIDARAPERFRGETEPIDPVAGHIPGARNRPTADNLGEDGRFLPAPELRAAFDALGAREGVPMAAYCGSGVTAAHEVLALELAGFAAALYPGSWSEWITDSRRGVGRESASPGPT